MKQKIVSCFTAFLLGASLVPGNTACAVDQFGISIKDGFEWEYWNSQYAGKVRMSVGSNGFYECSWEDVKECLFKTGLKLGSKQTWDYYNFMSQCQYNIDFKPEGDSYISYYGWTEKPELSYDDKDNLVEYYIVEAWGTVRPCEQAESLGTFSSNGKEYDIYCIDRIKEPSIHGNVNFEQYWSVAKENPAKAYELRNIESSVYLSNHFEKWEENGMKLGNMYEMSLQVLCNGGSGYAKVFPGFYNIKYNTEDEMNAEMVVGTAIKYPSEPEVTDVSDVPEETTAFSETTATAEETVTTCLTDISEENVTTCQTDISEEICTTDATENTEVTEKTEVIPVDSQGMLYGDIDGNGVVELTDLTVLSVYLLGDSELSDAQLLKADVQYDGIVDIADLARLKQYICKDPNVKELGPQETAEADSFQSGKIDGYDWSEWNDDNIGEISMEVKNGGRFSCSWKNIKECSFSSGKMLGSVKTWREYGSIRWEYDVDYKPEGVSYLGLHGWTDDPAVEYFIIEAWGTWRPPGSMDVKGTVASDGKTYDVFTMKRYNQPSIHGTETYEQYWSVVKNNPASAYSKKNIEGSISVFDHFKKWEELGLEMGKMHSIEFYVEGYDSNGCADVKKNYTF